MGAACREGGSDQGGNGLGTDNLDGVCEAVPPFTPNFEPELEWAWTGSSVLPEYNQVMMTPAVADVNGDGIPDIIFSTFHDAPGDEVDWKEGVLRAISGDDGHDLWAVTDPAYRIKAAASIAVGDIDHDGKVEICGIPFDGRGIICYENDGTFKFRSAPDAFDYNEWGGPSLADLDGDGTVEILDGNRVYSNTGALKWVGSDGMDGAQYTGPVSFAMDIDGDGQQELVNGRAVYRADGSLKCANTDIQGGLDAVANFDADNNGEIVVSGYGKVSLLDDDCTLLWSVDIPGGCVNGCGGAPAVADVDHDGFPEIAVAGENAFTVFNHDGSVRWTSTIQDWSSGKSGGTAFDFEDDGKVEFVYGDEVSLRIYDGSTGAVKFETRHSSGTTHENPVIADVDGDLAADLVVAENDLAYPPYHGIRVYHDRLEGWARTRGMWNQHAYSITNVNNDGSIPMQPARPWMDPRLNTFRSNVANYFGDGPSPFAAPDLSVSGPSAVCEEIGVTINATVNNDGDTTVAAGLKVAFYWGDPASGGALLGVATIPTAIPAKTSAPVMLQVAVPQGNSQIFIVADDDGTGAGRDTECDEGNNTAATVTVACGGSGGGTDGGTGGDTGGGMDGGTGGDTGGGMDGGTGGDTGDPDGGTGGGNQDGGCDHGGGGDHDHGGGDGDHDHDHGDGDHGHDHDGGCDHDHDHGDGDHGHDHDGGCDHGDGDHGHDHGDGDHDHDHDGGCDHDHDHGDGNHDQDHDGGCDHDHDHGDGNHDQDHDGGCDHDSGGHHDGDHGPEHDGDCGHDHDHDGHCDHHGHDGDCDHGGGSGGGGGGGGSGGGHHDGDHGPEHDGDCGHDHDHDGHCDHHGHDGDCDHGGH